MPGQDRKPRRGAPQSAPPKPKSKPVKTEKKGR